MSPSSRLCLLAIVALVLPSRGQTPEKPTPGFAVDQTPVNPHAPVPESSPEVWPTPSIPSRGADDATGSQTAATTESQQPTGVHAANPVTDPKTHRSSQEGTTTLPRIRTPFHRKDLPESNKNNPFKYESNKNDPFKYDEGTLRKRGLLVAAVLFITGIIILTSGKCRQFSRMCLNRHRAYRVIKP
ncbi:FXYD domain-containing ion transport regulator 5 isoform X3 [Psammomys obesus]|uniref:FXYD domain-containing ion transport regulator 5 isoform X3 n=1 Tax=Psammomys obesus TaxID=48139 RepID=UPI002452BFC1|nr:FXYD domain-containing ion transport regulator 5 isoform X3 [Psammomys obesus]